MPLLPLPRRQGGWRSYVIAALTSTWAVSPAETRLSPLESGSPGSWTGRRPQALGQNPHPASAVCARRSPVALLAPSLPF